MKRTFTVNLNNIVFHIDNDAYEMLQRYLLEISSQFQSDSEKKEIMDDIEARIAELFTERLHKSKSVITSVDVEAIIETMGKPNQYSDEDTEDNSPNAEKKQFRKRRFYRDPENTVFAGIAGGVSAYFDWDVTLVRIIMVLLVFFGAGFIIPVYLVLWVVVPQALSASQRLEMQGEDVTVESIKSELNNVKSYMESEKFKQSANNFAEKVMSSMPLFVKIALGFMGGIFAFVGVILIGVLLFLLSIFILQGIFMIHILPPTMFSWMEFGTTNIILILLSILLLTICPIYLLVISSRRLFATRSFHVSKISLWMIVAIWIVGILLFFSVGVKTFLNSSYQQAAPFGFAWGSEDSPKIDEKRDVAPFNKIEVKGNIELILVQDSMQQIIVTTQSEFLPQIITNVENGILHIGTEKFFLNRTVKVMVTTDTIQRVEGVGASSIRTLSQLNLKNFSLHLLGASQADIDVNVKDSLTVELKGASKAQLKGSTNLLTLYGEGASRIEAYQLLAQAIKVKMVGASRSELFATESIDAQATGASTIEYRGNPKHVKQNHTGVSTISIN